MSSVGPRLSDALRTAPIFVAGHRGLVGSAVLRALSAGGAERLMVRAHAELDLTDAPGVRAFFERERPEYVVLCAAKVGGIVANDTYPAEFLQVNLAIQGAVIHEAWRAGARRLVFLGSSCIYPRDCPQPMREDYLLTGALEPTNRAYAIAKIAGVEMCWSYNRQYGTRFVALMPANCYGPGDNYALEGSHVLPAMIRKFHEGKVAGNQPVVVWGSGRPRREFLFSDDLGAAVAHVLALPDADCESLFDVHRAPLLNVGAGKDITIAELAAVVRGIVGHTGAVEWDGARPDGTPRKLLDVSRMRALGWQTSTPLREGIERAYRDFKTRFA